jgi:uncharacterized damage-inducible protein DinB
MRLFMLLLSGTLIWGQNTPPAGVLTQGERDRAMSYLHATQKQVTDTVNSLSPAQLAFHASPNSWSVGDCLEHLALTETALFADLTNKVLASPEAPEKAALVKGKDQDVIKAISTRDQKFKAPAALVPSNKWSSIKETLAAFRAARKKTIAYVESTPAALRLHVTNGPEPMDGYQVILMIGAHTERHLAQMKEVMASPNFPKS